MKPKRDSFGRIVKGYSGNPKGRPKGTCFADEYYAAMKEVEKEKRKSLLKHYVERAYVNDYVLVSAVKKILPDLSAIEAIFAESGMSKEQAQLIRERLKERFKVLYG